MDSSKTGDLSPATLGHKAAHPLVPPGGPPRPPALSSSPDAVTLLKALRRRWALAVGLGLLLAGVVGPAVWFGVPPAKYKASSTMFVSMVPKRIIFEPQENRTDPRVYQTTQAALLKDRFIIAHALNKPEVASLPTVRELLLDKNDPEEWLIDHIQVAFRGGSELLEVSLSGDRAKDVAEIVNAVVASYMTLVVEEEQSERVKRLEQLQVLWEKYQKELKTKRQSLEGVAAAIGSDSKDELSLSRQLKGTQLSMVTSELMRVQADLLREQAELKELESTPRAAEPRPPAAEGRPAAPAPAGSELDKRVDRHPDVAHLKAGMDDLARKYQDAARLTRVKSDPSLLKLSRRWHAAATALGETRARVREEVEGGAGGGGGAGGAPGSGLRDDPALTPARAAARLKARVEVQKGYRKALEESAAALQREIQEIGKGSMYVEDKREEITIASDFSRKVGSELEYVKVELNGPPRIKVLKPAVPPKLKDELRKTKATGVAVLGSFALTLLGVSLWEFRARRIDNSEEVVSGLGLRLVGALPALPAPKRREGRAANALERRWQSTQVESIDAIRTLLLHASRSESVRVLMVTSAMKGEGKTSLSCHLAPSLARAGRKTLLIDGDLRSPSVHRLFDQERSPGVCEYLRGEATVDDLVRGTAMENLNVVVAGRCDPLALQALAQDGLGTLLDALRNSYDFIVVDSAPVLPVADSLLISQHVDGVLLSVLLGVSRLPAVYAACERLSALGVRTFGVVVNGTHPAAYASEYY